MTKAAPRMPKVEINRNVDPMAERLTILHVANGWVIKAGNDLSITANEFTHVAVTPDDLVKLVRQWAVLQSCTLESLESLTQQEGE